jgi:hypothetical protein
MNLTKADTKIIAYLLETVSDHLSREICNDLRLGVLMPDIEERRALMKQWHEDNDDSGSFDPESSYEIESGSTIALAYWYRLEAMASMNKITSFTVDTLGDYISADSMLGAMQEARIFKVSAENGFAILREECDGHFAAKLGKYQLLSQG